MTEEAPETDSTQAEDDPDWLKALRKKANKVDALEQEVAQLRRGTVMDELGIPKTGSGALFRDKWDGDPDDLDALKAAARKYELIPSEDKPDDSEVTAAVETASQMADLSAGGAAEPTYEALLGEANTIEEIERIAANAGVGVPIR